MARLKNDGMGRLGGRLKGTSNKVKSTDSEWIDDLLLKNRKQFELNLKCLSPEEHVRVITKIICAKISKSAKCND